MINIKVTWSIDNLRKLFPAIADGFGEQATKELPGIVVKEIEGGKSPVEGLGRYEGYSPSYTKAIGKKLGAQFGKRARPVNLKLTGKMLGTVNAKTVRGGTVLGFKDPKAVYHDQDGAGKSKALRRMLPTRSGETFSRTIMQKLRAILRDKVIGASIDRTGNGSR